MTPVHVTTPYQRERHQRERRTLIACLVLILIMAGAGLSACSSQPTAPIIGRNCGAVHLQMRWIVSDPSGPITCLWQAYQHCETATLVFTQAAVDTGTVDTLTARSTPGGCAISDAQQSYINVEPPSAITTYACGDDMRQVNGGLLVTCVKHGAPWPVMVPRYPAIIGTACGNDELEMLANGILVSQLDRTPNALACIVEAEQSGHTATLVITGTPPSPGPGTELLVVECPQGSCAVSHVAQGQYGGYTAYACAGVYTRPDGGLLVSRCGAEGDIVIPPPPGPPVLPLPTPTPLPKVLPGSQ